MNAHTTSDALVDALVALCQQLGGLVNADLSEVKAQGGLHVLSLHMVRRSLLQRRAPR